MCFYYNTSNVLHNRYDVINTPGALLRQGCIQAVSNPCGYTPMVRLLVDQSLRNVLARKGIDSAVFNDLHWV